MLEQIINNYTLMIVLAGTILLGITTGIVGVFLTLKKEALIGDTISHTTLPGVVLAFMMTNQSSLYVSLVGAFMAALIAVLLMEVIKRLSKIKSDALLAIILSSAFGLGSVLLSIIRDTAGQDQIRLKKFIFGQTATMSSNDVLFIFIILVVVLITVFLFFRHFKLAIFNPEYYQALGFSNNLIRIILNVLTILVVVSGIQSVGVVLMSALLIAPAVAARLWSNVLKTNLILSSIFGTTAAFLGTLLGSDVPTGPVIVIIASLIVLISLLFAPKNGFIWIKVFDRIHAYQIRKYHGLIHVYETNQASDIEEEQISKYLKEEYLVLIKGQYKLTGKGIDKVKKIMAGEIK